MNERALAFLVLLTRKDDFRSSEIDENIQYTLGYPHYHYYTLIRGVG